MTTYNPRQWTSHLFDFKGAMVREITGRVVASVVWATIVVVGLDHGTPFLQSLLISPLAHSLIGTALGLLLVFRTNSSYDRYWEGRKLWGSMINESRNLARQVSVWLASDPMLVCEILSWVAAFPYATMQRVRNGSGIGTTVEDVADEEIKRVETSRHIPLAISRLITERLLKAQRRGLIDSRQLVALDQNLQLLVDYCGGCERIRTTPIPFAYAVHLRRVLILYCFSLPLALAKDFDWGTIPATLLMSYSLFGIEEIGIEIEDPFGYTPNDLPVEQYCAGLKEMLAEFREQSKNV